MKQSYIKFRNKNESDKRGVREIAKFVATTFKYKQILRQLIPVKSYPFLSYGESISYRRCWTIRF